MLWALSNGQRLGWHSLTILGAALFAFLAGTAFVVRELSAKAPLLNVSMFRVPGFAAGCVISFCFGAGLFGSTYLVPLFVQQIQGFTATASGLLLMPAGLVMALIFPIAGHMVDRFPAPAVIALGAVLLALSSYLMGLMDASTMSWVIIGWVMLSRVGLGFGMPAIGTGSLRALDISQVSQGSGAANFSRQLGGALGVNLLSVTLDWRTAGHARVLIDTQTAGNVQTAELVNQFQGLAREAGLSLDQAEPAALVFLREMVHFQAYVKGFQDSFLILAAVFLVSLAPVWVMYRFTRAAS
ncbi:MAG: MFS transporter [Pseudomonas sp.]